MAVLEALHPKKVFRFFEEISNVPRGSQNTKKIEEYLVNFARERNLEYSQDEIGNIIIKKEGSKGYENSEPVIIQGHMDMVCVKTQDSDHDFTKDPLELYIDGDYIKAKDTTLGGDNGIAIAYALAILDYDDLEHPPLEIVITVDEEIGMLGAQALDMSQVKGKKLINLDSEEEGTITTGCAGAYRSIICLPVQKKEQKGTKISLTLRGLVGGHSGSEIDQQRGNADLLMGRLLVNLNESELPFSLISVNGGDFDNVIPNYCEAELLTEPQAVEDVLNLIKKIASIWRVEFDSDERNMEIITEITENATEKIISKVNLEQFLLFVNCAPQGVQCFSRQLEGLVETSENLGYIRTKDTEIEMWFMGRSSIESKKKYMKQQLNLLAKATGATISFSGDYPGWMYKSDSVLRPIAIEAYKACYYNEEPIITAIHAGLECGMLIGKKPDLDCISFGPELPEVHSLNERLGIASTQRTWEFLLEILKRCK